MRVCITGAAGQIAYSLLFAIARGDVFGSTQVSFDFCVFFYRLHCRPAVGRRAVVVAVVFVTVTAIN